jgi:hypothetical protein
MPLKAFGLYIGVSEKISGLKANQKRVSNVASY